MSVVDLIMPKLGESIMEATILKWLKKPGDKVEQDETVLEIATDKVDSEVPSTTEGTITEILYNENDVVPIGKVIARIKTNAETNNNPAIIRVDHSPELNRRESHYEDASLARRNSLPARGKYKYKEYPTRNPVLFTIGVKYCSKRRYFDE